MHVLTDDASIFTISYNTLNIYIYIYILFTEKQHSWVQYPKVYPTDRTDIADRMPVR